MKINIEKKGILTIASLEETRLDASVAPDFKQRMEQIVAEGNTQIILDLSRLTFMDSSSLGATVAILKFMGSQGKIVISGASGVVLELFKLTRMDRVFTLKGNINEAEEYFAQAA